MPDLDELFRHLYDEARQVAVRLMQRERPDHTWSPTVLVHEAYLRLRPHTEWSDATHFRAWIAITMRHLLVDHARARRTHRRGGDLIQIDKASDPPDLGATSTLDLLDLEDALDRLNRRSSRQSRVVELRVFGGLTTSEIANVLEVSESTIKREWRFAVAWLRRELEARPDDGLGAT